MKRAVLAVTMILLVMPSILFAQWTGDALVNVPVSTAPGNQAFHTLISDGADGAISAWRDDRGNLDLYMQRLSAEGVPLWTLDGVLAAPADSDIHPQLAPDGQGGAYMVWRQSDDVWFQHVDASGTALIGQGSAGLNLSYSLYESLGIPEIVTVFGGTRVAWVGDGHAYLSGTDASDDPLPWRVDLGDADKISLQYFSGAAGMVWTGGDAPLQYQQFSATGDPIYPSPISMTTLDAVTFIDAVALASDDYGSDGVAVLFASGGDYYLQVINDAGELWSPTGQLLPPISGVSLFNPPLLGVARIGSAYEADQPVVAAQLYGSSEEEAMKLHVLRYDFVGQAVWPGAEALFTSSLSDFWTLEGVVGLRDGGVALHGRQGTVDSNILAKRVGAAGDIVWEQDICVAPGNQDNSLAVATGPSELILVWNDRRDSAASGFDLYAERAPLSLSSGVPGQSSIPGLSLESKPGSTVELAFALPSRGEIELTVHDVTGRRLRTLAQGDHAAGHHALTWDGRDAAGRGMASGVYLVRLRSEQGLASAKALLLR